MLIKFINPSFQSSCPSYFNFPFLYPLHSHPLTRIISRAGHATTLPRQLDHFFRPQKIVYNCIMSMYIRIFHFDTESFHFFVFLLVTEQLLCSRVGRTLGSRVVVGACPPLIIFSHLSPSIRPHIISPRGPSNPRPLHPPAPPHPPLPPAPCLICKCYPSPPPHQIHFAVQSGKTAAGGRAAHRRLCVRRQRRPDTGGVHARHLPPLHPAQGTSLNILEPD